VSVAFFDASAIVKRYATHEVGSARVQALCHRDLSNVLVLADITPPEVASALGRKLRTGEIDQAELQRLWLAFVGDRGSEYSFVHLEDSIYRRAEQILLARDLRASDAIQIACALHVRPTFATIDPDFVFITADQRQATAAGHEGLAVELIA
jgi:predicted nucleic acid-binding protein